jgi:hypothetical protein
MVSRVDPRKLRPDDVRRVDGNDALWPCLITDQRANFALGFMPPMVRGTHGRSLGERSFEVTEWCRVHRSKWSFAT